MLAVTVLATRVLGAAQFGAYAIASSVVILSRQFYFVGAYEYLLKTPEHPRLKGSCLAANSLFAVGSTLLSVAFAEAAPFVFAGGLVKPLVLWLTPSLFIAACTAWFEALLLRRQRLRTYYAATLTGDLVAALATLWGFRAGWGVFALVLQTYVRLLVLALFYVRFIRDARGWRQASLAEVGTIVRWSWPRYLAAFLNYWAVYGADLLLGALLTPAASGLYRASNRIVSAATDLFGQPLLKISQTRLSGHSARGRALGQEWLILFGVIATFAWAALGGLAAFAPAIVEGVLGHRWAPAVPIVVMLCAVRCVTLLDAATASFLACANQQHFILRVQITVAVCIVVASALTAHAGPLWVAGGVGLVGMGGSTWSAMRVARLSGVTAREAAGVLGTAAVPLGCVLATAGLARVLGRPATVASAQFVAELGIAAAGGLLGLALIRRRLLSTALAFRGQPAAG